MEFVMTFSKPILVRTIAHLQPSDQMHALSAKKHLAMQISMQ
jgi:hypothetical protein